MQNWEPARARLVGAVQLRAGLHQGSAVLGERAELIRELVDQGPAVGKWSVSTYLSGKKTTSAFNRTVTTGYIPHGSLSVPANKVFHVQAEVVGPDETFVGVPNACRT